MRILLIDTTTKDMIVAVVTDNEIIDASTLMAGTQHSEGLCLAVQKALQKSGLTFADLDAYACSVGPGSFTGIRIGISTVKGHAAACPKPFIAVNCLEAAARSPELGSKGKAIIDAGNGYYFADYVNGISPELVTYDNPIMQGAAQASFASQYMDGLVQIIRNRFAEGSFDESLQAVYIRKSQAELTLLSKNGAK